jgi:hypothetical protein
MQDLAIDKNIANCIYYPLAGQNPQRVVAPIKEKDILPS